MFSAPVSCANTLIIGKISATEYVKTALETSLYFFKFHYIKHRKVCVINETVPGSMEMAIKPFLKRMTLALDTLKDLVHDCSLGSDIPD